MAATKIRTAAEVAEDGQSFTAPLTFEVIDPASREASGQLGPGVATLTDLLVRRQAPRLHQSQNCLLNSKGRLTIQSRGGEDTKM